MMLSLLPIETVAPMTWFSDTAMHCERHGLVRDPGFWTAVQRARPAHCDDLHRFRRQYIARDREPEPPRISTLDAAVVTITRRFNTARGVKDVLCHSGWHGDLPPANSAVSLLHWALISLVRSGDAATLFRVAATLQRLEPSIGDVASLVERLAICACDREIPTALRGAWLDIQQDGPAVDLSFRAWDPNAAHDSSVPIAPRTDDAPLAAGLSLRMTLEPSGRAVELQLRAHCEGPWLGKTLRLCHGVHSFVRRLLSASGDRLGDADGLVLVLHERLELEEST